MGVARGGGVRFARGDERNVDPIDCNGSEAVEGLVVTVLEGKRQAVLVNVVGDIRPEKLALIGERFHIEPLKKISQAIEPK